MAVQPVRESVKEMSLAPEQLKVVVVPVVIVSVVVEGESELPA